MRTRRWSTLKSRNFLIVFTTPAVLMTLAGGFVRSSAGAETAGASRAAVKDDAAKAAFLAAYPVFMHGRCLNCHPQGDVPFQATISGCTRKTSSVAAMAKASTR